MTPQEIAEWVREEHLRVHKAVYELHAHLAIPPSGAGAIWLTNLREGFAKLCTHLRNHMAMEENGGYMKNVMKHRPTLSRKVEKLLHEHRELDRLMREVDASLAEMTPQDKLLIRHAIARIGMFLSYVDHHKEEEENLVMYAFTTDLGAGD